MMKHFFRIALCISIMAAFASFADAQGTRLLRQPTISNTHVAFTYGGDLWIANLTTQSTLRLTSTPAVESDPHFSPDGKYIAFTSNRSGSKAVYTVPVEGGTPTRLSWHPSPSMARGWTPNGSRVLYASSRETAPKPINRLWSVATTGGPSTLVSAQWGFDGSFSADGTRIVVDRVSRWDTEWRGYRGGQNTPLIVLNLADTSEVLIPNEKTTDIQPLWLGKLVYFLSDRDGISNIWSYDPASKALKQLTNLNGSDIKWLDGRDDKLVFEREGYLHMLDLSTGVTNQLELTISGDFSWAETKWEDVKERVRSVSLSPNGKRAIMEARGEIFTVPVEHGDARNITQSGGAADRAPIWSPKGDQIAWLSDAGGKEYQLMIASQDGLATPKTIAIGESKMAWEPSWSPDGKSIAFTDDDVRIKVIDVESGTILTADVGGTNMERGDMGLCWSPDSEWLAYSKTGSNGFRRIMLWSKKDASIKALTNRFADATSPSWDRDGHHFYFLASTDYALGSGWANTSAMTADPEYAAYLVNLRKDDPSPFAPRSDEESIDTPKEDSADTDSETKKSDKKKKKSSEEKNESEDSVKTEPVRIDFDRIERRTMALPIPVRNYQFILGGPAGTAFIGEAKPNGKDLTIQKYVLKDREAKDFVEGASQVSISANGSQMLARVGGDWKVMDAAGASGADGKSLKLALQMKLDRAEEWKQIFEEAWRYERDYFYDPNMHGRDWQLVYKRYAPLVPYLKHRADLTYVLDQMNGELSVGHSFVGGGDFPKTEKSVAGMLGADLVAEKGRWKIDRIYTTESWNPKLSSPLDRPDVKIEEGFYLVGINGKELKSTDDPYKLLDGTANLQTVVHINSSADFAGAWKEIVKPITNEVALRQRAWVEDNRRLVDKLSGGKLGYVWVPNTSGQGLVSFNRYYFAQQDKEGVVIDERFNGGGLLDDYMVDLMTRSLRAAITNEVPNGKPMRLPAGILGPKVLLINEMSGSGGDFFPWVFRQQQAGPLIGSTTWGGLVKSSVHYPLVDGGYLTAPDNAIFDPSNNTWVAENKGVAPDIAVRQDVLSLSKGIDPQLERAVKEALALLEQQEEIKVVPPPFSTPAKIR